MVRNFTRQERVPRTICGIRAFCLLSLLCGTRFFLYQLINSIILLYLRVKCRLTTDLLRQSLTAVALLCCTCVSMSFPDIHFVNSCVMCFQLNSCFKIVRYNFAIVLNGSFCTVQSILLYGVKFLMLGHRTLTSCRYNA